jgi:hypothetical protein
MKGEGVPVGEVEHVDAKLGEACRIYCDSGDEAKKDVKYCAHVN